MYEGVGVGSYHIGKIGLYCFGDRELAMFRLSGIKP